MPRVSTKSSKDDSNSGHRANKSTYRRGRYMQPIRSSKNLTQKQTLEKNRKINILSSTNSLRSLSPEKLALSAKRSSKENGNGNYNSTKSITKSKYKKFNFTDSLAEDYLHFFVSQKLAEEEKFKYVQAKQIQEMIQEMHNQKRTKAKHEADTRRIQAMKIQAEYDRRYKIIEKNKKLEQDKVKRLEQQRLQFEDEQSKFEENANKMRDKMQSFKEAQKEMMQKLKEKAAYEAQRRKQIETQRQEKIKELEDENQQKQLEKLAKAEKTQEKVKQAKEQALMKQKMQIQLKQQASKQRIQRLKQLHKKQLKMKKNRSLQQLKIAEKKRQEMNQTRIIQLQKRSREQQLKRIKVLEKKHQMMQDEAEKARNKVIHKEKIIEDRICQIKKDESQRSKALHQEIAAKQADAKLRVERLELEEEEYVDALNDIIQTKIDRIDTFQKEKVCLHEQQINQRLETDLRKQKFSNVIKEITRASDGILKLEKLGIDTSDASNIDVNELIQKLSSPNLLNHDLHNNLLSADFHVNQKRKNFKTDQNDCKAQMILNNKIKNNFQTLTNTKSLICAACKHKPENVTTIICNDIQEPVCVHFQSYLRNQQNLEVWYTHMHCFIAVNIYI